MPLFSPNNRLTRWVLAPRKRLGLALVACFLVSSAAAADLAAFREDARIRGNPNAPVTIIEYSDFTCGFCAKFFRETWPMLQARYVDTGKVRYFYRDYPRADQGPGVVGAMATRCAGEQGRFWAMHDRLFSPGAKLDPGTIVQYAKSLGLDDRHFVSCLRNGEYGDAIFADRAEGQRWGFRGTPGFVILLTRDMLGREAAPITVPGALPFSVFQEQIEEFLRLTPVSGSNLSSLKSNPTSLEGRRDPQS